MTAQSKKTEQKRLDSCALALPKWNQTHEKLKKRACGTLKISDLGADATLTVENEPENAQDQRNTTLLGKYRVKQGPEYP